MFFIFLVIIYKFSYYIFKVEIDMTNFIKGDNFNRVGGEVEETILDSFLDKKYCY